MVLVRKLVPKRRGTRTCSTHGARSVRKKFSRKLHLMVLKQDHWQEQDIFLCFKVSRMPLWSTEPPVQCIPRVKWPGREADDSPSCSVEFKNGRSCISTPTIRSGVVHMNSVTSLMYFMKHFGIMFARYVSSSKKLLHLLYKYQFSRSL